MNFELDTYWAAEAGADVVSLMNKVGERLKLWHITDRGSRVTGKVMTPIITSDSVELGTGSMPLDRLMEQAKGLGVQAAVLETHRNWIDRSPMKSIQISAKWINERV